MQQAQVDDLLTTLEQRIQGGNLTLPVLPQVSSQVMQLVHDPDSDAAALTQIIQSDQSMAGHVMRISNSAAYSPVAKITSLQQAIARLGMQTISEISLAATMGPKMFPAKGFESLIGEIWQSSLATALWSREISRLARKNVEIAFLCGLLGEIGRPVVLQTVLQISEEIGVLVDRESMQPLIHSFQTQVGVQLVDHWQLPEIVGHTITGLSGIEVDANAQGIVDIVKAAKLFAAVTIAGGVFELESLIENPEIVAVNLYSDDVASLLEKADTIRETTGALLP